jgi:hypothetical protein
VNFDNPIPTNNYNWNSGIAPANMLPKQQAHPLGGFSNPKMPPPPIAPAPAPQQTANKAPDVIQTPPPTIRKPLTNATDKIPVIEPPQNVGALREAPGIADKGSGFAVVDGKRINYQDIGGANDPLKSRGGYVMPGNGSATIMPSGPAGVPPIGGDKWSFLEDGSALGSRRAAIARKMGYVPAGYDDDPDKWDAAMAAQAAQFAHAENQGEYIRGRLAIEAPVSAAQAKQIETQTGLAPDIAKAGITKSLSEAEKERALAANPVKNQFNRSELMAKFMQTTKDPYTAELLTNWEELKNNGNAHPVNWTYQKTVDKKIQPFSVTGYIPKERAGELRKITQHMSDLYKRHQAGDIDFDAFDRERTATEEQLKQMGLLVKGNEKPLLES